MIKEILSLKGITSNLNFGTLTQLNSNFILSEEVNKFYPCKLYLDDEEDYSFIKLEHEYLNLTISENHKKQKSIYCNLDEFKNIRIYTLNQIREQFKPNSLYNFSILNTKCIVDWISYYEIVYQEVKKVNEINKNKIDLFFDSIKDYPIEWDVKDEVGEIKRNGLIYKFVINYDYIQESITLDRDYVQNLDLFEKLSANKLN